jgi:hypothetical protein
MTEEAGDINYVVRPFQKHSFDCKFSYQLLEAIHQPQLAGTQKIVKIIFNRTLDHTIRSTVKTQEESEEGEKIENMLINSKMYLFQKKQLIKRSVRVNPNGRTRQ